MSFDSDEEEIRLRVDRRQLEYILKAPRFCVGDVHVFERIARQHGIRNIGIDPNFKIGARSKKDPTVWVVGPRGNPRAMNAAKEAVLQLFDTKANRVALKVDVPHEHHFFVIGKKGENMKRVMSSTGCHIHFPDSNRSHGGFGQMKNQVSIAGTPDSVELARTQIRGLLPFTISFDVPDSVPAEDVRATPSIHRISQDFGVTIFFKQRTGRGPLALVKGTRCRASVVEQAAQQLKKEWTEEPLDTYTVQVDLSCPHHTIAIGKGGETIQALTRWTGAQAIRFPYAHKESSVFISGTPQSAKLAYCYLQGRLPVVMMFELSEERTTSFLEACNVAGVDVEELAQRAASSPGVEVVAKHKGAIVSFTLKAMEATASHLHATRVNVLQLAGEKSDYGLGMMQLDDPTLDRVIDDPDWQPAFVPDNFYEADLNAMPQHQLAAITTATAPVSVTAGSAPPATNAESFRRASSSSSVIGEELKPATENLDLPNAQHLQGLGASTDDDDNIVLAPGAGQRSAALAKSTRQITQVVARPPLVPNYEKKKKEAERALQHPDFSRERTPSSYFAGGGFSRSMDESEWRRQQKILFSHRMATISSPRTLSEEGGEPTAQRPPSASSRQSVSPSSSYGGGSMNGVLTPRSRSPENSSTDPAIKAYWNVKSLRELLSKLKLEQYFATFAEEEMDLATFLTLTDEDLRELGVRTFGARRKMSTAIRQLNSMRDKNTDFLSDVYNYTVAPQYPRAIVGSPPGLGSSAIAAAAAAATSTPRRRSASQSISPDFLSQSLTTSFNRRWTTLGNSGSGGTLK